MATRPRSARRTQPYDLNNPATWTSTKLRAELGVLGLKLNSSVPKNALKQLYEKLSSANKNSVQSNNDLENISNITEETQIVQSEPAMDSRGSAQLNQGNEQPVSVSTTTVPVSTGDGSAMLLQNTIGMVSSLQSTVSALQSTINSLLVKQTSSEKPSNQLELFYKDKTVTSLVPSANMNQDNGVAADELPHVDVVNESVKKNIISGKYVNLACLLIPDYEASVTSYENLSGLEFLKRDRRDHRLDRALSISQFFKAFGIYKRVMSEAYPLRRTELDLYEADIGNIYEHFGDIFYQYHVQFSKRAAAYMEKGIKVDWSKRHKDLFQLLIGGAKTKLCEHCAQADHQSPFCPSQINEQIPSNAKKSFTKVLSKQDSSRDIHGRPRLFYKGREICNNFNSARNCNSPICPHRHICKKCKQPGHGEMTCEPQTKVVPTELPSTAVQKSKQKPAI